jgi:integrase
MPRRAPGEGTIRKRTMQRDDSGSYVRWFARVTTGWDGKRKKSKDGPLRKTQKEAANDLKALQKQLQAGTIESRGKERLADYLESWLEHIALNKKYGTYRSYYQSLHTYVIPRIGHMRLDKVRRVHIQDLANEIYKDARERGKDGRATVRKAVASLRKALEDAIRQELLPGDRVNPCSRVEIPAEYSKPIMPWTPEEVARLFEVAKTTRHYAIIYTALTTGMREAELLGLKWSDLESTTLDQRLYVIIHIRRILVTATKKHLEVAHLKLDHVHGRYFFDTPKTKKSMGSILAAEDTWQVLGEHKERQEAERQRLGERWYTYDLVFPATGGLPQSQRNLLRDYRAIVERAGIPYLTFHDLRDMHSSRLQAAGVELAAVSQRLRHSRPSTTADKYTHPLSGSRVSAAMTLEQLLRRE